MQYYDDNDKTGKRAGVIATALYVVVVVVLLVVVRIEITADQAGEGILIDFGDVEMAGGSMSEARPVEAENRRPSDTPPQQNPEELMTQDVEEAPVVTRQQPQPERKPSESERTEPEQAAPPAEKPREVDRRALFPGSAARTTAQSQGTSQGEGRQGAQEGTPGGNPDGTGVGAEGAGFSLAGRSIVGRIPEPRYGPNKSGRVVVEITVDATGKVIRAVPRGQGSTTNDSELISAAMEAAAKAQFNRVEGDGLQTGTITYNFILK